MDKGGALWGVARGILREIHRLGAVHVDVRRQNVLVDKGGKFWWIDFGLAKVSRNAEDFVNELQAMNEIRLK